MIYVIRVWKDKDNNVDGVTEYMTMIFIETGKLCD